MFEILESRRLFAATITLDAGVLKVIGTDAPDTLLVTESAGNFEVGTQDETGYVPLATVPESMVTRVVIDGQGGDDFLALQTSGTVGGDVLGGEGNDGINLDDQGTAVSIGHGGNGDDTLAIFGSGGDGTTAYGDNGSDTVISMVHGHTSYLYGGNAKDDMNGTTDTIIDGGNGKDTITVS